MTVEEFLADYPATTRDLALETRGFVRQVLPDATEHVYPGWRTIGYSASGGMAGQICYIAPTKTGVTLGFNRGTDLPDPHSLLTGAGKKLRHVKIHTPADLTNPALRVLLQMAATVEKV